jgi:anti-sigma factor RsiW
MTTQSNSGPFLVHGISNSPHLSETQMGDLLAAEGAGDAATEAHLHACTACTAEVAEMRASLVLFREASTAYADRELRRAADPRATVRTVRRHHMQPAYWVAAIALLTAGTLSLEVQRHTAAAHAATAAAAAQSVSVQTPPKAQAGTESDEALLEAINRDLSDSVPTPMQALADPTGTALLSTSATSK